jgi:type IV secretion system protein VirB9
MRAALRMTAFAVGFALATAAQAAETPRPGPADPRIKAIDYDPQQVVRIVGAFRTATQIRFGPDESVLHVALGDTAAWEVAAETSLLFIKPTVARPPTDLIVTTQTPSGETRHYTFELSAHGGSTRARAADIYVVVQFR